MKLKSLLFLFLFPIAAMAATTNVFERVLIRQNFQFTGGTVGPFKVMTSDVVGNQSPQSILYDAAGLESVEYQLRVLDNSAGSVVVDWENSRLRHQSGISIDWGLWIAYDQNGFQSINWDTRQLIDNNEFPAAKWNIRQLCDTDEISSVSWQNRTLDDNSGSVSVNWNNRTIIDSSTIVAGDWENRVLKDQNGGNSIRWEARTGLSSDGNISFDYENRFLTDGDFRSINWASRILQDAAENITVNWNTRTLEGGAWTINGLSSGTFLTNIANNVGISWAGQGTPVMTPSLNYSIIVTNGSAASLSSLSVSGVTTLTGATTNVGAVVQVDSVTQNGSVTNNGLLAVSNVVYLGTHTVKRRQVSANTTNNQDYYIAWKGTTAAQVTNFLSTNNVPAGRMLIIKDAQRAASLTNIILFPMNGTTIGMTNSMPINVNGQSITIIYDGTSNWELN